MDVQLYSVLSGTEMLSQVQGSHSSGLGRKKKGALGLRKRNEMKKTKRECGHEKKGPLEVKCGMDNIDHLAGRETDEAWPIPRPSSSCSNS
jgi:hypothetical protein